MNKRKFYRIDLSEEHYPCLIYILNTDQEFSAKIKDISANGMTFQTYFTMPTAKKEMKMNVKFTLHDHHFSMPATFIRTIETGEDGEKTYAIQFDEKEQAEIMVALYSILYLQGYFSHFSTHEE